MDGAPLALSGEESRRQAASALEQAREELEIAEERASSVEHDVAVQRPRDSLGYLKVRAAAGQVRHAAAAVEHAEAQLERAIASSRLGLVDDAENVGLLFSSLCITTSTTADSDSRAVRKPLWRFFLK